MDGEPVVEVANAHLRFSGDVALDGVDFRMFAGEVHSLMGENGAGKSTLIKAMTGALRLDSGDMRLNGEAVSFADPAAALRAGISTVYQEIDLLPNLSVAENIMLGREPSRAGGIDWPRMRALAAEALAVMGVDIDPRSPLSSHSLATQQLVAIARAVSRDVKVLILDEPTSSLDQDEVNELFRVIRELKAGGVAILFVSHFLEQVYEIGDRITVLRNGKLIGEYKPGEMLRIDLVQKMLGKEAADLTALGAREQVPVGPRGTRAVMTARGIGRRGATKPTDLDVFEGELLGLAGLLGSGRSELARILTGIDPADTGELTVDGKRRRFHQPRHALKAGIAYSTESRKSEGIVAELSVRENITLALQADVGWLHRIPRERQDELSASWIEALDIRPADPERRAGVLSGGNQQKVLLARLLAVAPRVLVLDEPTRGIDIGAKVEIQRLIGDLASNGMSVVFISAELEEVLRVGHRIVVLRDREIVATLDPDEVTFEMLLAIVAKADGDD
jgi:simple sugar transport system ATP-binding protein